MFVYDEHSCLSWWNIFIGMLKQWKLSIWMIEGAGVESNPFVKANKRDGARREATWQNSPFDVTSNTSRPATNAGCRDNGSKPTTANFIPYCSNFPNLLSNCSTAFCFASHPSTQTSPAPHQPTLSVHFVLLLALCVNLWSLWLIAGFQDLVYFLPYFGYCFPK